jgi:hypothetical protein
LGGSILGDTVGIGHRWRSGDIVGRDRHHLAGLVEECGEREQSVRSSSREKGIRLFAGVLTAAKNHRARQAIRESWGSHPGLHRYSPP